MLVSDTGEGLQAGFDSRPRLGADVARRLARVRDRIAEAALRTGRDPQDVTLVAVSKLQPLDRVLAAYGAGQRVFAESQAQELVPKVAAAPAEITWHFVGRLQRNKVRQVVGSVALIHSVDRVPLAEAIARHARRLHREQRVLVQVNVGADPAKAGCSVAGAPALVDHLADLDGVMVVGLMTMPPLDQDPGPLFARLCALRDALRDDHPDIRELSMGMSADFEVAIAHGATLVRIGEAVFGPRPDG